MSVLVDKNSKVIVQGFTGGEGTFHSEQMLAYGTNVVGGVTPGKGGQEHLGKPVFNTVQDAVLKTEANVSIIFVPPAFAADAVMEAAEAGIKVVICITEGIPVSDMIKVKEYLSDKDCRMVGPNCPGVISADEAKVGIMPGFIFKKGTTIKDAVELLMNDEETHGIIMIGEIGGNLEAEAGKWIKENGTKPVVAFIAGDTAPKGRTMGHAGAIVGGDSDTASAKKAILKECGVHVVDSPADLGTKMFELLS